MGPNKIKGGGGGGGVRKKRCPFALHSVGFYANCLDF